MTLQDLDDWCADEIAKAQQLQNHPRLGGPPFHIANPLELAGRIKALAEVRMMVRAAMGEAA